MKYPLLQVLQDALSNHVILCEPYVEPRYVEKIKYSKEQVEIDDMLHRDQNFRNAPVTYKTAERRRYKITRWKSREQLFSKVEIKEAKKKMADLLNKFNSIPKPVFSNIMKEDLQKDYIEPLGKLTPILKNYFMYENLKWKTVRTFRVMNSGTEPQSIHQDIVDTVETN